MTHAELAPLLEARKAKVRVARKHVPLRMHPHAMDAAKAGCCGETLGKGDQMADALFNAPPEELTPEGCEAIAKAQGLDLERFRACVKDPATATRIEKDKEAFRAVKGHGLPTIWIDGTRLEGAQDREMLQPGSTKPSGRSESSAANQFDMSPERIGNHERSIPAVPNRPACKVVSRIWRPPRTEALHHFVVN